MSLMLIYTTIDNETHAHELAERLLSQHLAACVSVGAATVSHYVWQGKKETAREYPLTIKTTEEKATEVKAFLRCCHPYSLPEIVCIRTSDVEEGYLDWVVKSIENVG